MARRWPDHQVIVELDCSQVFGKLQSGGLVRSLVAPIIGDILKEGSQLRFVSFSKIRREQNRTAHELAHLALCTGVSRVSSDEDIPSCIFPVLYSDSP